MIEMNTIWRFTPEETLRNLKECESELRNNGQYWKAAICDDAIKTIAYLIECLAEDDGK